jgi:nucleoside-diphosphate-sugar epimerase
MAESSSPAPPWLGPSPLRCLVTGASGYIGGRLVRELLAVDDLIGHHPGPCLVLDLAGIRQFLIGHDGIVLADGLPGRSAPDIDPQNPASSAQPLTATFKECLRNVP